MNHPQPRQKKVETPLIPISAWCIMIAIASFAAGVMIGMGTQDSSQGIMVGASFISSGICGFLLSAGLIRKYGKRCREYEKRLATSRLECEEAMETGYQEAYEIIRELRAQVDDLQAERLEKPPAVVSRYRSIDD